MKLYEPLIGYDFEGESAAEELQALHKEEGVGSNFLDYLRDVIAGEIDTEPLKELCTASRMRAIKVPDRAFYMVFCRRKIAGSMWQTIVLGAGRRSEFGGGDVWTEEMNNALAAKMKRRMENL